MMFRESFPKKVWNIIMLNPHPFADEIKRYRKVEVLLVTRDRRTGVMEKVLNRLETLSGATFLSV
jgi:hypothetical protein